MAAADVFLLPATPWTLRLIARTRMPPFWAGLAMSVGWFGLYLLYSTVFGVAPDYVVATWPSEFGWALVSGMAPAVTAATLRGAIRDLEDLAPALRRPATELAEFRREIATVSGTLLKGAGIGVAAALMLFLIRNDELWDFAGRPASLSDPAIVWYIGRNVVNWWLIARALIIEVATARAFSRLAARLPAVDLLDRTPLAPFGRRGLRSVLLWMLYLSLFSLQYVLGSAQPALAWGAMMVVSIAIAALLLPVWGAHMRLREAKVSELKEVHACLTEARERTLSAPADEVVGGRLADLVAWERRISTCSEWPFSSNTVLRFGLYTAIGLGSWLGAAFVERLLESALG